jgi:phosphoglycerate dehydrogenase-like enzyme
MTRPQVLLLHWLPDSTPDRLAAGFPDLAFVDGRDPEAFERHWPATVISYGLPPVKRLAEAPRLRWIQIAAAGVPRDLCPVARQRNVLVTNLAGLYGPTIAEHALAMMLVLARNLHVVLRHQQQERWDRDVAQTMSDLHGRTLAVVGAGNIGQAIARLARCFGMGVLGCGRTLRHRPFLDRVYPLGELHAMLAEADVVAVALPLTAQTEGMLGPAEFRAMKRGALYVNVSRGAVAQEPALLAALQSGHLAGAGLDVYTVEPLAAGHPFWSMPQVLVSPHYSGETVNLSTLPVQRFLRNLRNWQAGSPLEGTVDLEQGY